MERIDKLIPDTSVLIEGLISKKIENNEIKVDIIIVHEAVLAEIEHQVNIDRDVGKFGLDELNRLRHLAEKHNFEIRFMGRRPTPAEIKYATLGEIDAMIRELAWNEDATLLSSDRTQTEMARVRGVKYLYLDPGKEINKLKIEMYFSSHTMSIHLRENVQPMAKVGKPGDWKLVELSDNKLTQSEVKDYARDIIEMAKLRDDGFLEFQSEGSTIAQIGTFRIVIARPPFSDGWEITAVRPIKKLKLEDYNLSEKLMKRIEEQAEGILIAGAPGDGKSTISAALAEFYMLKNKTVKTIEAPRDLVVADRITQYAISHATSEEIKDILLLTRPDYTIFDEMRNTADFRLFSDLRLAGIGLVGVEHATNPIDAIQRFVGRVELGVIPQVIDTVIFIKRGQIDKVLGLQMTVKVPSGMTEADLARPVVEVRDFETNRLEFEIYSYGEETVVVPVRGAGKTALQNLAEKQITRLIGRYADDVKVNIISEHKAVVYVPAENMARLIGKQGTTIEAIEKKLGMHIDVQELLPEQYTEQRALDCNVSETGNFIVFYVDAIGKSIDFFINGQFLFTATSGKKGIVKVHKKSKLGRVIDQALRQKQKIELKLGLD